MNSKQAKKINLPDLMRKLGYEPTAIKKDGKEYWYRSPFRNEKEASFHTSYLGGKWIWNDFGDIGGTVIDFVMRHQRLNGVGDALSYLDATYPANCYKTSPEAKLPPKTSNPDLFSFQQQDHREAVENFSEKRELEFIKAYQVKRSIIYAYLENREIPRSLTDRYLREVQYRNVKSQKEFFAFGMKNESGGYEIRAASDEYSFKSSLIGRDITLIKGQRKEASTVNIFEGMIDFLSLLVMLNVSNLAGDSIIMHSLSSFQRTLTAIESMKYQTVNLFLDNNKSGKEYTAKFQNILGEAACSQSSLFEPYEDLNDALKANAIPDFLKKRQ